MCLPRQLLASSCHNSRTSTNRRAYARRDRPARRYLERPEIHPKILSSRCDSFSTAGATSVDLRGCDSYEDLRGLTGTTSVTYFSPCDGADETARTSNPKNFPLLKNFCEPYTDIPGHGLRLRGVLSPCGDFLNQPVLRPGDRSVSER